MTYPNSSFPMHRILVWCYTKLARALLPARFCEKCGDSLVAAFSDGLSDDQARSGIFETVLWCAAEFLGLTRAAVREHWKAIDDGRSTRSRERLTARRCDITWFPRELQHSLRSLAKSPGVVFSAVVALALGIGATTTMFSVSHGLLRDLPFEEADDLVYVGIDPDPNRGFDRFRMSVHEISDWRGGQATLESLSGFSFVDLNLSDSESSPERVQGARVSASAFDALRVPPVLGRNFRPAEELPGAEPVVIIGYTLWKNRYGLDPNVLGRTVRVNGVLRTVVGVMPEGFHFPELQNIWIPLELDLTSVERGEGFDIHGFGRLTDDATLADARVEITALARRLELAYPDIYDGLRVRVIRLKDDWVEMDAILVLNVMVVVVSFVLVIACANVANLLLARAASRSREIAVRTALGASRSRVIGQMLAESLVISLLGGALGILLAYVGVAAFTAPLDAQLPFYWMDVRVDGTVLLFTLILVLLSSVIAGIAPALKVTGVSVNAVLKDEALGVAGLRLGRLSGVLVVGQVALSCGLLSVSGLMVKGVLDRTASELAFSTNDVLNARVTLLTVDYPENTDRERFYREAVDRLEARPEVAAAALTSHLPAVESLHWRVQLDGAEYEDYRELPHASSAVVSPEFFGTLGVGLIEGRGFTPSDDASSQQVSIVNRSFAERFFPGESPLGRRFKMVGSSYESEWKTVVGVAPDLAMNRRVSGNAHGFYLPYSQHIGGTMNLLVRAHGDPLELVPAVREVVASLDPDLPIYGVNSLERTISIQTVPERVFAVLFICCGGAALVLAVVGLYGVMAFTVRRRTREIGIRRALGAKSERILWLSFRGGFSKLLIGLAVGLCLAALVAPTMQDLYDQTSPWDWQIYLTIVIALCASGSVASLVPAARATRVDPMETLRYE